MREKRNIERRRKKKIMKEENKPDKQPVVKLNRKELKQLSKKWRSPHGLRSEVFNDAPLRTFTRVQMLHPRDFPASNPKFVTSSYGSE